MNTKPKITFSVRFEPELREQLNREAAAADRPVTSLIRNVLRNHVARAAEDAEARA